MAVTVHEVSHGYAALRLGDDTAYLMGRLTLNPIAHIDLVGTILLPIILYSLTKHFDQPIVFGWAKPVPVNPLKFRRDMDMRTGMSIVAAAGPLANVALAIGFAGVFHGCAAAGTEVMGGLAQIASYSIMINLFLAFFNFIPIPPLDGSKVLFHFLKPSAVEMMTKLEPYGFLLVIILFNYTPLGYFIAIVTAIVTSFLQGGL